MKKLLAFAIVFILGSVSAQGGALEDGKEFSQNGATDKAAQKYKMACDGKNMEACGLLGEIYSDGSGGNIRANPQKAATLYDKACKGNDAFSCNNLGELYAKGTGVNADRRKAMDLFNKACKLKNQTGCENSKTLAEFMKNSRPNDPIIIKRNVFINSTYRTGGMSQNNGMDSQNSMPVDIDKEKAKQTDEAK